MKKFILGTIIAITAGFTAKAQMPYNVTVQTKTYTPLTGGTSINAGKVWEDETYSVPLGFTLNMDGKTTSMFHISAGNTIATDSKGKVNGFSMIGTSMTDRGTGGTTSLSPIRYKVEGNAGSRIFKAEVSGAGFTDELDNYTTLNDSANYQIWLYEGTNEVEIHFGPSLITHQTDYFPFGGPMVGYNKEGDIDKNELGILYLLKGSAAKPTVDSFKAGSTSFPCLSSYPASGTVYRFTPKSSSTSVKELFTENVSVYPTQCTDAIYIDNKLQSDAYYTIVSTMGTTLKNGKMEKGENRIDVSGLASGMYLLRMDNNSGYDTRKFVKL